MMRARARKLLTDLGVDPRRFGRVRWIKKLRVLRAYRAPLRQNLGYVLTDPEIDNFSYDIANRAELADFLAAAFGADRDRALELIVEADENERLNSALREATSRRWSMKTSPPLGRRLGWYAAVRLARPETIVETGIHDGIGSLVLLAALDRNGEEGAEGRLVSFDIDSSSGWIVGDHPRWTRIIESTTTALEPVLRETGAQMFLHDSLHTYEHEYFELSTAARVLGARATLLSDNSHATTALADVAKEFDRPYAYFAERPRDHFYPGGGIGLSAAST